MDRCERYFPGTRVRVNVPQSSGIGHVTGSWCEGGRGVHNVTVERTGRVLRRLGVTAMRPERTTPAPEPRPVPTIEREVRA